ncbi:MAG: ATP-binding protein [Methanobrevibacter sp.]|nr:ATP-binding protein [Methanobrevibacter sp.]
MFINGRISPFQPGEPVKPEQFQGRQKIIDKYSNLLYESSKGKSHHFFITGKRGMGKTSLARYLKECARHKYQMIGVHIVNEGIHDIDGLIIQIVENILNEIEAEKWSKKIINAFTKYVDKVGLFGVTFKFKPEKDMLHNLRSNFAHFLMDLISNFEDKQGIFIIIDDVNGLSKTPEFANWYKSFTDTLATSFSGPTPIAMMLTGYSEKLEALSHHNESFSRIFKHANIGSLPEKEIKNFFIETFNEIDLQVETDALNLMTHFSSGLPTMMQEIGDGVFLGQ